MPETDNVYAVPDLDIDVFFWNGWWWRPWQGGWYRSRYYSRGWGHYGGIPTFYYDIDPGWRRYYRDRNWYGNPWRYERIHYRHLHQNWRKWHNDRHWERQRTWGIQDYRPRPQQQRQELRRQREREYYQRSEVRQYQQQLRQQQQRQQRQYRSSGKDSSGNISSKGDNRRFSNKDSSGNISSSSKGDNRGSATKTAAAKETT